MDQNTIIIANTNVYTCELEVFRMDLFCKTAQLSKR